MAGPPKTFATSPPPRPWPIPRQGGEAPARLRATLLWRRWGQPRELVGEYDDLGWNRAPKRPGRPARRHTAGAQRALASGRRARFRGRWRDLRSVVKLGGARLPKSGWQAALTSQLASNELVFQLAELVGKPRPLAELPGLMAEKVGREVPEAEVLAWLALGAATGRAGTTRSCVPWSTASSAALVGRWSRSMGRARAARLWLSGEDAEAGAEQDARRFGVTSCTTCGQHYYETWLKDFSLLTGVKGPRGRRPRRRSSSLASPSRGERGMPGSAGGPSHRSPRRRGGGRRRGR